MVVAVLLLREVDRLPGVNLELEAIWGYMKRKQERVYLSPARHYGKHSAFL